MSHPYREQHTTTVSSKLPRIVVSDNERRLIQTKDNEFIVEIRTTHTDAMGAAVSSWNVECSIKTMDIDPMHSRRMSLAGLTSRDIEGSVSMPVALWLCSHLLRVYQ